MMGTVVPQQLQSSGFSYRYGPSDGDYIQYTGYNRIIVIVNTFRGMMGFVVLQQVECTR